MFVNSFMKKNPENLVGNSRSKRTMQFSFPEEPEILAGARGV